MSASASHRFGAATCAEAATTGSRAETTARPAASLDDDRLAAAEGVA